PFHLEIKSEIEHSLQLFFCPFLCADKVSTAQIGFHSILSFLIVYNPCSSLTLESFANRFWHGYQCCASTTFKIINDSFDLRSHTAFRKMTLLVVSLSLV